MHVLRYPGSKCKLSPEFWTRMPYFDEYREPCLGSASVLAYVFDRCEEEGRYVHYWGNDLNHAVMSVWWALKQGHPFIDEATAFVETVTSSEDRVGTARTLFETAKWDLHYGRNLAMAEVVLSIFSFGQYVSRHRRDIAPFGMRFANALSLSRTNLLKAHHRLKDATLTCKPLMEVLREPVADGVKCLAYIDPPYPIQHKTHGAPLYEYSMLTYDEHIALFDLLATLPYPFMLSYSKGWFTDVMLKRTGFRCEEIPYKWTGTRRSTHSQGEELIITNYDPTAARFNKDTAVVRRMRKQKE